MFLQIISVLLIKIAIGEVFHELSLEDVATALTQSRPLVNINEGSGESVLSRQE